MDEETEALQKLGEIVKTLKRLKIVRTNDLEGDIGSYYTYKKLGLSLMPINNKGYDAEDKLNNKYEIKTRRSNDFNILRTQFTKVSHKNFDFLVTVNLDYDYSLLLILKIPCDLAMDLTKRNKTGNLVISKDWLKNNKDLIMYQTEKLEIRNFKT